MISVRARAESWPIRGVFTIARGSRTHAQVIVAEIERNGVIGRGECVPYARYGETCESVLADIARIAPRLDPTAARASLQTLSPAGGARNALDCALWPSRSLAPPPSP
jgi:L-Ala-D/L-Glu epimerase